MARFHNRPPPASQMPWKAAGHFHFRFPNRICGDPGNTIQGPFPPPSRSRLEMALVIMLLFSFAVSLSKGLFFHHAADFSFHRAGSVLKVQGFPDCSILGGLWHFLAAACQPCHLQILPFSSFTAPHPHFAQHLSLDSPLKGSARSGDAADIG